MKGYYYRLAEIGAFQFIITEVSNLFKEDYLHDWDMKVETYSD